MCRYRFIILLLLVFLKQPDCRAQKNLNYPFRHLTVADGLLHNEAYSIVQDGKGFIWIVTKNGLQRYDGNQFVYYPDMITDPAAGLVTITEMFADKKNNLLWLQNNDALEKMDLKTNRLTYYTSNDFLKAFPSSTKKYIENSNSSWLLNTNTVYNIDKSNKNNFAIQHNFIQSTYRKALNFTTDQAIGQTWVTGIWTTAGEKKILLLDDKTGKVFSNNDNPSNHPLLNKALFENKNSASRFVMIDDQKNIWITTWGNELYRYNPQTKKVKSYYLPAIRAKQSGQKPIELFVLINCMIQDDHKNIWLGTENAGLLRYNAEKDNFDYCIAEGENNEGLRYNYKIFDIFQDKEQNIWIGTDKGINIFNPYRQYFQSIHHEENNSASLSKNEIMNFIQAANGDIIAGTWGGGLTVFDSAWNFKKNISFSEPLEYNLVWSFAENKKDAIWIGCQHGYIHIYNPFTGSIHTIHPPELNGFTIRCMTKDKYGNIWIGLHDGKIAEWNEKENKFYPYNESDNTIKPSFAPALSIFFDSNQRCWVTTAKGLKQFDTQKREFTSEYLQRKNDPASIPANILEGIEEYNDSTLLIASQHGGLIIFNTKAKTFSQLTTKDGLPGNSIHAIKKDAFGYIWLTSDFGLYKFKFDDKKFIRLNLEPGTLNTEFDNLSFYPLKDGRWLTSTTTEIICFNTKSNFQQEDVKNKAEITGFKIFDNYYPVDSLLAANKPILLSYQQNFITIEFALLNFSNLQQTNYSYRLVGVDKDWVNSGVKRFANYTDLQPGEYPFEVKAELGNNTSDITSFKIIIAPPFWKTIWFRLLCFVLIALIVYAAARWRIKNIRNEAKKKLNFTKQMAEMEMKALRSQMNPHFIFNCINSIDALIQSNDKYRATMYLNKFAKLLRNILDSNKHNTVLFSKDIDTLKLYVDLELLRHENKFKPIFKIDNELLNSDYKVPPLIIQPFVENAILHGLKNKEGNDGVLTVDIKKVKNKIQYGISDNGIGRVSAEKISQTKESHYGMQISIDRIKLFNNEKVASVEINDLYNGDTATGTEVKVYLNIL